MSWTKVVQDDKTVFEMDDASADETMAVILHQDRVGADRHKTVFKTYVGEFTLDEILRDLQG